MYCCESTESSCKVTKLWEAARSSFHDAELQNATKEINAILDEAQRANRDPSRELRFVQIEGRHLLAWVHSDVISSRSGDKKIAKMLRLKNERAKSKPRPRPRKLAGEKA